jgi:hypothetical protein
MKGDPGDARAVLPRRSAVKGLVMLLTLARLAAAVLLIASAAAFATGAAIERHTASSESQPALHHAEADSPGENPASAEPAVGRESPAAHAADQNSEDLLGIDPEASALVVIAVAVSLVLAALILTVGSPLLAVGVALAMLAFTALDIREMIHQLHESRPGLAALAAAVGLLHLLAGGMAILATREARGQSRGISAT